MSAKMSAKEKKTSTASESLQEEIARLKKKLEDAETKLTNNEPHPSGDASRSGWDHWHGEVTAIRQQLHDAVELLKLEKNPQQASSTDLQALFELLKVGQQESQKFQQELPTLVVSGVVSALQVKKAPSERSASLLNKGDLKSLNPVFKQVLSWDSTAITSADHQFEVSMEQVEKPCANWNSSAEEKVVALVNMLISSIASECKLDAEVGPKRKFSTKYFQSLAPNSPRLFGSDDGVVSRKSAKGFVYSPRASLEHKKTAKLFKSADWKTVGGQVFGPLADLCLKNDGEESFVILSNWEHWWFFSMIINQRTTACAMKMCYFPKAQSLSIMRMLRHILSVIVSSSVPTGGLQSISEQAPFTGNGDGDGGEEGDGNGRDSNADEGDDSVTSLNDGFTADGPSTVQVANLALSARNVNALPEAEFWFQKCHPSSGLMSVC